MGIGIGRVVPKRELYLQENDKGYIVELLNGKDMYTKIKKDIKKYKVDCQAPIMFSADVLDSSSCIGEYFYIKPDSSIIVRCDWYNDLWFTLNLGGRVKKKTMKLLGSCIDTLEKSNISMDSMCCFIKHYDGKYHLIVDSVDCGSLEDDSEDLEFKQLLTSIFKDIGGTAEVVIFPSRGSSMFFTDTLGVYRTVDDFYEACRSKRVLVNALV